MAEEPAAVEQSDTTERERNALIGMNMRDSLSRATKSIGSSGKFVVLFSPERKFLFSDGSFHNLTSVSLPRCAEDIGPAHATPQRLFAKSWSYIRHPELRSLEVSGAEADAMNAAVQVYSKNALFFRSGRPEVIEDIGADNIGLPTATTPSTT